jgi:hypothetical protein
MPVNLPHAEGEIFSATVIGTGTTETQDLLTLLTSGHRARIREYSIFALTTVALLNSPAIELWRGSTSVASTGASVPVANVTNPATGAPQAANFAVTANTSVVALTSGGKRLAVGAITPDGFVFRPPLEMCPVIASSQRFYAKVLTPAIAPQWVQTLVWEDLGKIPGL